jgi:DNA-binding MarR family transcriptional regulator
MYLRDMAADSAHRSITFLLSQIGADVSAAFDSAVSPLGITPSEAGLLRLIAWTPGISQKAVSERLGIGPSRVVAVLDRLQSEQYVERRRSTTDRRSHEIVLTAKGEELLAKLRTVAKAHEDAFTAVLGESERQQLAGYLETIARARGLSRELHAGTTPR